MKIFKYLLIVSFINIVALSQDIPPNLQAALFKKIFSFDKGLGASASVVVLFNDASSGVKDQVVSAFKDAGINVSASKDASGLSETSVVYVCPGVASPKSATAKAGALSVSGVSSMAESGAVSVAIGTEGGKPKIIINMGQLKAEKHELSADLLKMAKVIQ